MAAGEGGLDLQIRPLRGLAEFERTVELQQAIWGFADVDAVPSRIVLVASRIGGIELGVFEHDRMIAFCFTMPGRKRDGRSYLHSHMTGVLPEFQNRKVGQKLKLAQRAAALAAGYDLIEWTFDPLEIRNCHFNLERLGVIVKRYEPNIYGLTSSRLHGAIPTDRLVAEWHLNSPRVEKLLEDGVQEAYEVVRTVAVPGEASRLRGSDPARAAEMQSALRERIQAALADGLTIYGYRKTEAGGEFLFGREQ